MSHFTKEEIEYLQSHRLGRLATLGANGELHIVPCRYHYNEGLDMLEILGAGMGTSKKYRDVKKTGKAAFVIDDVIQPGGVRGVEVRGSARAVEEGGDAIFPDVDPQYILLAPARIVSWGIMGDAQHPFSRRVK